MVAIAKGEAWDLYPHRFQCLKATQTEGSSLIATEGRYACIKEDLLKDDWLPLLNSDSDWEMVESDDEGECIFPYSPNANVIN